MSASKEKKIRKEQRGAADRDSKAIQAEKDQQANKKTTLIFAAAAILFVAVGVFSFIFNSGIMQKKTDAVTINGESYSPAQVEYYFSNTYQNFVNENYYMLSYYGLNTTTSLKVQPCLMLEDGTWHDYFLDAAVSALSDVQALCDAAEKNGLKWNDDMQATYDAHMASLEASRTSYNEANSTTLDTDSYLARTMGKLVTEKIYQQEIKRNIQAQAYINQHVDTLVYTDTEIEDAYNANRKEYDRVSFNLLRISGNASTTDANGKAVTPTEADKAAAMAEAKALAEELLAKAQKGETLKDLSSAYTKANLSTSEAGTYYDDITNNWLFDEARQPGDLAVLEDTSMSYYYVVQFNNRFRHDYNTVNVRHVLLQSGYGTLVEGDAGYEQQQEMVKEFAMNEAVVLHGEWQSGDATEESFAELAKKHSIDTGSSANGGLIEEIYVNQMVPAFNDWCFDESRKPGDSGVIYDESTGAHIMYYVGEGRPYWKVQVENALAAKDYNSWYETQTSGYEAVVNDFGMSAVG